MPTEAGHGFQHLHPASLIFILGEVVRPFLLPLVVVLLLGGGQGFETWFVILAAPAAATALARYATYRYRLADDELIIRHGILQRNERHVPFERIQNIDMSRSVLHRAMGVANVTIQTASGTEPEAVMRVLSVDAVEAMRSHVFGRRRQASEWLDETGEEGDFEGPDTSRTLIRTPVDDLVRYGIISNKGMIVLAAAIGLLWQLSIDPIEWVTGRIPGLETVELPHLVAIGVLLLVLAVIGLRILSVLWAVVSFYDFTLRRADEELGAEFGLLTQRTVTIPIHRIQLVTVEENLLHRALHRVSVRARTAGSASGENAAERHDWLAPVVPRERLQGLLADVDDELSPATVEWRPLPRRAVWRAVRRAGLPVLVVGLPPAFFQPWLWVVTPAVAGLFAVLAALAVRHTFWGRTEHGVWLRRGWLNRTTRAVRYATIQTVALAENPFDRRARMADVEVDTANSGTGTPAIRIPYLEAEDARQLAAELAERAARTPFRW
jgi:putative membrane protein